MILSHSLDHTSKSKSNAYPPNRTMMYALPTTDVTDGTHRSLPATQEDPWETPHHKQDGFSTDATEEWHQPSTELYPDLKSPFDDIGYLSSSGISGGTGTFKMDNIDLDSKSKNQEVPSLGIIFLRTSRKWGMASDHLQHEASVSKTLPRRDRLQKTLSTKRVGVQEEAAEWCISYPAPPEKGKGGHQKSKKKSNDHVDSQKNDMDDKSVGSLTIGLKISKILRSKKAEKKQHEKGKEDFNGRLKAENTELTKENQTLQAKLVKMSASLGRLAAGKQWLSVEELANVTTEMCQAKTLQVQANQQIQQLRNLAEAKERSICNLESVRNTQERQIAYLQVKCLENGIDLCEEDAPYPKHSHDTNEDPLVLSGHSCRTFERSSTKSGEDFYDEIEENGVEFGGDDSQLIENLVCPLGEELTGSYLCRYDSDRVTLLKTKENSSNFGMCLEECLGAKADDDNNKSKTLETDTRSPKPVVENALCKKATDDPITRAQNMTPASPCSNTRYFSGKYKSPRAVKDSLDRGSQHSARRRNRLHNGGLDRHAVSSALENALGPSMHFCSQDLPPPPSPSTPGKRGSKSLKQKQRKAIHATLTTEGLPLGNGSAHSLPRVASKGSLDSGSSHRSKCSRIKSSKAPFQRENSGLDLHDSYQQQKLASKTTRVENSLDSGSFHRSSLAHGKSPRRIVSPYSNAGALDALGSNHRPKLLRSKSTRNMLTKSTRVASETRKGGESPLDFAGSSHDQRRKHTHSADEHTLHSPAGSLAIKQQGVSARMQQLQKNSSASPVARCCPLPQI
jgi:hypothetical protein